jgi:hypothetical protein
MSARNYAPKLLALLRLLCKYIRKYQPQLQAFVGTDNEAALTAVVTACEAMEDILGGLLPPVN